MNTMGSFTVQNDLLSVSSMPSTYRVAEFQSARISNKRLQEIESQAKKEIYREENERLFNPFEHKLAKGFGMSEEDVFLKEKQRVQQQLKRKQEERSNQSRNYTIVFHEGKAQSKSHDTVFQMCANSMLSQSAIKEEEYQQQDTLRAPRVPRYQPRNPIRSDPKPVKQNSSKTNLPQPQQPSRPISKTSTNLTRNSNPTGKQKLPPKPATKQAVQNDKNPKFSDSYEGPDLNLVQQLQREIIQSPNIGFQSIAELQTAKQLLQEAVLLPKLMPEFFQGIRRATKGILLFGPPGTGKTMLAKAVSKGNVFFNVSASSLASKWRGQSEKLVRILFDMARFHAPAVIFFDEIDALGSKRTQDQGDSNRKVKTELLVQMDGVNSDPKKHVFVLAATNRPWDLDEALRRRLQKRIYIPLPSQVGRKEMFKLNLKTVKVDPNINMDKLSKLTKDYSGADIAIVCRQAAYMPLRKKVQSMGGFGKISDISKLQSQIDTPITEEDLVLAIKNTNKSVGNNDMKRYQVWMKQFGSS